MIATFKETWASVRNLDYGQEIIKKTVGQAFWYWLKYVLVIAVVIVVLAIAALTYFVPQISKLAERYVPDVAVSIKDGQLTTNAKQPLVYSADTFAFILNTEGQPEDIDQFDEGVLVLKDRLIFKGQAQTRILEFSDIKDEIRLDKPTIVGWLEDSKLTLLGIGVVVVIFAALFGVGFYTVWHAVSFVIGAVALWAVARLLKRDLDFIDNLKLGIYASVPALLISLIFVFNSNQGWSMISLAVWAFFGIAWVWRLPVAKTK